MAMCVSCSGSGSTTCFSCGGRRQISRLTISGDMDISACLVCGGKGRIRCQFCQGSGAIGAFAPTGRPAPRTQASSADVLAGRWQGQGGSYEFVKRDQDYALTEYGAIGRTGSGTATLTGNAVTLNISNVMLGEYSVRLQLQGDTLRGNMSVLGIPMPFVLTRA